MNDKQSSPTWAGWLIFGGVMMMMLGAFNVIEAVVAWTKDDLYAVDENDLLILNYPTWGWISLIVGLVVIVAGLGVLAGQTWARAVGVAVAALNAIARLTFIATSPFWSTIVIALDIVVIYALIAHGAELGQDYSPT
jgi:hypothetical protein